MTPGLSLHTSNRLERLVDRLSRITADPLRSPFTPEIVVVQSNGMRRWLTQRLAEVHGICANVRFPFPQNFFNDVIGAAFPEQSRAPLFDREVMAWRILQLLPTLTARVEFAPIARYLEGNDPLRTFQLAQQIAHVFDQYLVFRPELILKWDAGEGNDWQPILWRAVAAGGQHQVALARDLSETLKQKKIARDILPERLSVFGISTLPPFYIALFDELASAIPVHLFVMEPTPEWWGDIRSEREKSRARQPELFDLAPKDDDEPATNPLLAANAKLGRDFLNLIFDLNVAHHDDSVSPSADTILHTIQRDIFELRDPVKKRSASADDFSLQIHSCHSPVRELEVLRDQLLALFEKIPALKPKDIVVMMPDVSVYAPFIDAVFGVPENPAHKIPYSIADRSARATSGVVDAFLRLLEIVSSRMTASEVLALLESPSVLRRFRLEPPDLELIRGWIEDCKIRWGVDAEHRTRFDLPAFADNTWRNGFDRMLLGAALMPRDREMFGGILPYDEIEGSRAELLGRFVEFGEQLFALAQDFQRPRSLADWQRDLIAALDRFLDTDDAGERELLQLRGALKRLETIAQQSANNHEIALSVILAQLEALLADAGGGAGFLSGEMTFCALKPMRSIPFSVVCLLGLNDTAYPRHERAQSFDLIAQNPKRGDRHRRDDDRALFLEALLSAREVFYLSYLGRSLRDNNPLPPSVLVSELMDYTTRSFKSDVKDLLREHALQAFSPRYFQNDARIFSYSVDNCAAGCAAGGERIDAPEFIDAPLAEPEGGEVDLEQLMNFFVHPAKFFLRERLGLQLPRDEEIIEDREPFALAPPDNYQLAQDLVIDALNGGEVENALAMIRARGILPPGEMGAQAFDELCGRARAFVAEIQPHLAAPSEPLLIDERVGNFRFTARLDEMRGDTLVQYRLAKLKPKDFIRLWLKHLARHLVSSGDAILFGADGEQFTFAPVENARELLADLFALYAEGLRRPLRFFPKSSWAFMESLKKGEAEARKAARKAWLDTGESWDADARDAFIEVAFRNADNPLNAEWRATTERILQPLFAHRQ